MVQEAQERYRKEKEVLNATSTEDLVRIYYNDTNEGDNPLLSKICRKRMRHYLENRGVHVHFSWVFSGFFQSSQPCSGTPNEG